MQSHSRAAPPSIPLCLFLEGRRARLTNNDYILAFGNPPKLVTVRDGRRTSGLSKTLWIGDKASYEQFREFEHRARQRHEHGRAINAAMFADEMTGSPASDLHGIMRNVVQDRELSSVGGFVTVIGNRDIGFRYSVYSDILLDWPQGTGGRPDAATYR